MGEGRRGFVDISTYQSVDPGPECPQRRNPAAARIERGDRTWRACLGRPDRPIQGLVHEAPDGRADTQSWQEGETPEFGHPYQALEVAASVMP